MMKSLAIGLIATLSIMTVTGAEARGISGYHYTRGYVRKNGTYVSPHFSTNPNGTKFDNWSTKGNVNPFTGKVGTVDPFEVTKSNPTGSPYNYGH